LHSEQSGPKKRSRYSTLPIEVDEALAIINRQLEVASHSKSMLEQATTRLHILEQDLMIERGKTTLTTGQKDKEAEVNTLKDELKLKQDMIDELTKKIEELLDDVKCKEAKIKDLEAWKMRMKMMIDGN
jgi:chromosome segregation ATPase